MTLDHTLFSQVYYDIGDDMRLLDLGQSTEDSVAQFGASDAAAAPTAPPEQELPEAKVLNADLDFSI